MSILPAKSLIWGFTEKASCSLVPYPQLLRNLSNRLFPAPRDSHYPPPWPLARDCLSNVILKLEESDSQFGAWE